MRHAAFVMLLATWQPILELWKWRCAPAAGRLVSDESEHRALSHPDVLPQIFWIAGPDGRLDDVNGYGLKYTGMTFDEALCRGWAPVVHPDDREAAHSAWTDAVRRGVPYESQYRLKRACDGTYRWHLGRANPVRGASGSIAQWYGTCIDIDTQRRSSEAVGRLNEQLRLNTQLEHDISARKRAEASLRASDELFRQVEEHAPIGLALMALDGSFIRVNPALCALTGFTKSELLSMSLAELTMFEHIVSDAAELNAVLAGDAVNVQLETRYLRKDGRAVWIDYCASLVRDEAGEALYFIAQTQDISDRKAAELIVAETREAALAANDAKSRFLATMSHEIRTPMNAIIGMAELVALSSLTPDQYECISVIRDSGRSLLRVLNDILDFSKIEAGKLGLEIMDFDLRGQIESIVTLLAEQVRAKDVSLTTHVESQAGEMFKGDSGRVRQILLNLVGNALKFTPAGGNVDIGVAVSGRCASGALLFRFTVTDTGVGIPSAMRDRLFLPFSQVDDSTTRKYGGTGLGLSICKHLVEMMGGEIGVESDVDRGSTFWFTLPLMRGDRAETTLGALRHETVESVTPVQRRERILLAEDNPVNVTVVRRQFRALGFEITVAANGREAVDAIQREAFDVIFMDCHMPELDGLDATREIRRLASPACRAIPIIAMTADAQAEDREACFVAGMNDYISKPAVLSDLQLMIERWIPHLIVKS